MPQINVFNPDAFLISFWRALNEYVTANIDQGAFQTQLGYPKADQISREQPLEKTLIHFEVADMTEEGLGLGDSVTGQEYDEILKTIVEWEAHRHVIDMDIGIWASAESGGVTLRLEARQLLSKLFNGPRARLLCMTTTEGIEILSIGGGRNFTDEINSVPVWRMVDIVLRLRVFSRTKLVPIPFIDGVDQSPGIEIDDTVIIG
jgi:hypothetical protein